MHSTDERPAFTVPLGSVAGIQAGYPVRGRIEPDIGADCRIIQAGNAPKVGGLINTTGILRFKPEGNIALYRVSPGDVLLLARGHPHAAYLIDENDSNLLASSAFYILRADLERVLAAYLAWWVNQPKAQAVLDAGAGGTGISYLRRGIVEALPLALPPLREQRKIVRLLALWQKGEALRGRLAAARHRMIEAACDRVLADKGRAGR